MSDELQKLLRQLIERVDQLEKKVDQFQKTEIKVEQLTINNPVIENLTDLTFRLDELNIKELSGSLNMGNNFGSGKQAIQKQAIQKQPEQPKQEPVQEEAEIRKEDQKEKVQKEKVQKTNYIPNQKPTSSLNVNNTDKGFKITLE